MRLTPTVATAQLAACVARAVDDPAAELAANLLALDRQLDRLEELVARLEVPGLDRAGVVRLIVSSRETVRENLEAVKRITAVTRDLSALTESTRPGRDRSVPDPRSGPRRSGGTR